VRIGQGRRSDRKGAERDEREDDAAAHSAFMLVANGGVVDEGLLRAGGP
jgi:hypothetical protein